MKPDAGGRADGDDHHLYLRLHRSGHVARRVVQRQGQAALGPDQQRCWLAGDCDCW